ncbi:unnamed protein product, partial [Litomosoides sigmodontis]
MTSRVDKPHEAPQRDQQGIASSAQRCRHVWFGKFGGKIQIDETRNSHDDKYMSEDNRNPRKLRVRGRIEEENDGFSRERIKSNDTSTKTSETATESGDVGRTKRKSFPDLQEVLRNQSEIGEACCESEHSAHSGKRFKKLGLDSGRLLDQADEHLKSRIINQEKDGPNCEDDAVDVVSSSDDPLAELDVESSVKKATGGFGNRRKVELGGTYQQYTLNQAQKGISPTRRDVFVDDDIRYGYDGPSGSGTSNMLRLDRKPVPVTAPLLTTERTHVRVAKRKHDEAARYRERRLNERDLVQRNGRGRSARTNRYYYEEEKPLDDVGDVMYAEIGIDDSDFIETSFEEEELIYAADDDLVASANAGEERCDNVDAERVRKQSVQETQEGGRNLPKQEDVIEQVNEGVESNDDDTPPELEPQSPALQKVSSRSSAGKHDDVTNFNDGVSEMQVICVQTPNGTEQFIQLAPGQTLDDDNLFVSESDNVETNVRHDLRAVEFNFLDSKNICCGLCGEIVPHDLLLSSHIPQHHPEVLEEGVTAFEDVPYESWLREKLSEEKRRIENSASSGIYDDLPSSHNSGRIYRSVSTIRVNPNEMTLNQLITALRKKMFEKLGRTVPVTLVDKQHARCGICNAVVSLNRKFEVVHLVRHFNAWHPSVHQCAGKWKLKKPQAGLGKPLSIQDFAVIDTTLDRGANLQCIWCGMFMAAEALAMHFSEVHPEEVEVPKCNLCLQELVINARLLEKYSDDFDVSMPDEHHIRCGKYGTMHTSEARLHTAIEKRLKLCEEGKNTNDIEDDEMEEEKATSYVNSRMTFGCKPKRQFIMPALRQAAPVNSRYVEAVNDCHWKCKMCNGDILAAVISAGAIRHFRTEHPHHLHNMQYELCKTRLERISDGCMEFINPQLIECLVCNMTYMLHRPFNMCRAIRHLRSKHPDLMPEFSSTADAGNSLQRKRMVEGQ